MSCQDIAADVHLAGEEYGSPWSSLLPEIACIGWLPVDEGPRKPVLCPSSVQFSRSELVPGLPTSIGEPSSNCRAGLSQLAPLTTPFPGHSPRNPRPCKETTVQSASWKSWLKMSPSKKQNHWFLDNYNPHNDDFVKTILMKCCLLILFSFFNIFKKKFRMFLCLRTALL